MKVLLVTMYFPPSGGGGVQRPLKIATHLPELGIETHVLAPDDSKWIHRDEHLPMPTLAWVHRARFLGPRGRKPAEELHGMAGLERESPLIVQDRLSELAQPIMGVPQIVEEVRVPMSRAHQRLVAGGGFVVTPLAVGLVRLRKGVLFRGPKAVANQQDQQAGNDKSGSRFHGFRLSINSSTWFRVSAGNAGLPFP